MCVATNIIYDVIMNSPRCWWYSGRASWRLGLGAGQQLNQAKKSAQHPNKPRNETFTASNLKAKVFQSNSIDFPAIAFNFDVDKTYRKPSRVSIFFSLRCPSTCRLYFLRFFIFFLLLAMSLKGKEESIAKHIFMCHFMYVLCLRLLCLGGKDVRVGQSMEK